MDKIKTGQAFGLVPFWLNQLNFFTNEPGDDKCNADSASNPAGGPDGEFRSAVQ